MKHAIVPALFAVTAFGQTSTTPVNFPAIPLPAAVAAFGEFNQLGAPRFTMGIFPNDACSVSTTISRATA